MKGSLTRKIKTAVSKIIINVDKSEENLTWSLNGFIKILFWRIERKKVAADNFFPKKRIIIFLH